jgi:predicted transcriptional regulator
MDYETLFTSAKWDILKSLASSKKSPIELAEQANTSISNISQSLRFLELAGIVKSERLSNRDKGQPRVIYSLASESAYIILTSKNFVNKKTINIDDHKKMLLNIWFYENENLHGFLESAVFALEESIDDISGIFLDKTSLSELKLAVVLKEKTPKKEFKELTLKNKGLTKKVKYLVTGKETIQKSVGSYYAIYDPNNLFSGEEVLRNFGEGRKE